MCNTSIFQQFHNVTLSLTDLFLDFIQMEWSIGKLLKSGLQDAITDEGIQIICFCISMLLYIYFYVLLIQFSPSIRSQFGCSDLIAQKGYDLYLVGYLIYFYLCILV